MAEYRVSSSLPGTLLSGQTSQMLALKIGIISLLSFSRSTIADEVHNRRSLLKPPNAPT
jgi:hypothetical protein